MTHQPNTPRARNAKGQKVDEPVQCVQCLQTWPCEVMLLSQQIVALSQENAALRAQSVGAPVALYGQPGREPVCDFDCDYCHEDSTLSEGHET
jgi:sulfatase maturation enzyme AslB (radical SAM superfamily)